MEIKSGNITLITLSSSKLEKLRKWRNDSTNNQFLVNRQEISKEDQELWFNKTKSSDNIYLIIQHDGKDIGLIYTSKSDLLNKTVETNILIGEKDYKKSGVALSASLIFTHFLLTKGGFVKLQSTVNKNHKDGLELDEFIGFEVYDTIGDFHHLSLNLEQFKNSKGYKLLNKISQFNPIIIVEK